MARTLLLIVYMSGVLLVVAIRRHHSSRNNPHRSGILFQNPLDGILTVLAGCAVFVLPLLCPVMDWCTAFDYSLPLWLNGLGIAGFGTAIWLLWRAHSALGNNWSTGIRPAADSSLVRIGVYLRLRHPMYAAHLLWAVCQPLLLQNWIAGWSFLLFSLPLYVYRIPREERMLHERYGTAWSHYLRHSGCLWPR